MSEETTSQIPPWAVSGLIWITVSVVGLFTAIIGWVQKRQSDKTDSHEKTIGALPSTYATIASVEAIWLRWDQVMPGIVQRSELKEFMTQMEANFQRRHEETREDRRLMHEDNKSDNNVLRAEILRVNARIDELVKKL